MCKKVHKIFVFRPKMAIFWRAGTRKGGLPLPLGFQYLILMIWRACNWNFVPKFLLASKWQDSWKMVIPNLKTCYFEASEDVITKFKLQALHIIRIKYWKASWSGNPPSLPPSLPHSYPPENCHFRSKSEIFYTFLHTTVIILQGCDRGLMLSTHCPPQQICEVKVQIE